MSFTLILSKTATSTYVDWYCCFTSYDLLPHTGAGCPQVRRSVYVEMSDK